MRVHGARRRRAVNAAGRRRGRRVRLPHGDTRVLKTVSQYSYSGGTPASGSPVTVTKELQRYR